MNELLSMVYAFARAAWHRRWLVVTIAWGVALLSWVVILALPDRYEASAKVYVDARTALRPMLQGIAIEEDYESQLSLVRAALLSRPQLEAVARKTNLDAKVTTPAEMDKLVTSLQKRIAVTSANAESSIQQSAQSRDTIYTISYLHRDRDKSIEVVRTLLENLVEGTQSGSRSGSTEAQGFLNLQIQELEKRLQDSEERLAEFKKRNLGMIPGERGDYFTRMNQEMAGLQKAETDLAVAISRRSELQRQLEGSRAYLPGTTSSSGIQGAPADVTLRRQEAEQHLEELLLRYTDKHPEVIAIRETIAELKEREAKEMAEIARGGMGTGQIRSLSVNPIYQQIQSQLNQTQVEIASHQGAAEQHRAEIADLRKYVDQAPEIEQELARLNRDYGVTKAQYDQLVTRREQARVSDDAARTGIIDFDVIEPPRAGIEPVWPNRPLLFIGSLLAAIGLGLGVALLPQFLSPSFNDVGALERRFKLPVLGSVSEVRTEDRRAWEHLEFKRVAIAGAALLAIGVLLAIFGGSGLRLMRALIA